MHEKRLDSAFWALRVAFGVVPIVAGLDKFTNLLADWAGYLSPLATRMLPVAPATFMHLAGIVEVLVGLTILSAFTRIGAWVATIWLGLIALNLISSGHHLDVAARDAVMAVGAFALAQLAAVREQVRSRATPHTQPRPAGAHA